MTNLPTRKTKDIAIKRKYFRAENAQFGPVLKELPCPNDWGMERLWRSRDFLVQGHVVADGIFRLTVNRTQIDSKGQWIACITWDELQQIKSQCGFADFDAVEVYPAEQDVVNVANMRHIWVLPTRLTFAWRKTKS